MMSTSACERMEERCLPGAHFTTSRQLEGPKVSYRRAWLLECILSQAVVCGTSWVVGMACEYFTRQFYEIPKLCLLPIIYDTPFSLQKGMFDSGEIALPKETGKIIIYVVWHAFSWDVPKQLQPPMWCLSINTIEEGHRKYPIIPTVLESLVLGSAGSLAWHKVPGQFMVTVIPASHILNCFLVGALLVMGAHSHKADADLAEN